MEQKNIQLSSLNDNVAAIYARVSSIRQVKQGYSIENQINEAKKFAEDKFIIKEDLIFKEDFSASKFYNRDIDYDLDLEDVSFLNRAELQKLMICAQKGMFKHLLVYTRDRFSRTVEEALLLQSILKRYGVEIHYTKKGESLNNENENINRFLHLILSSVAELESSVLSTRVKEGNKSCIEKGLWAGGRIPLGYISRPTQVKHNKENSKLMISNFEKKVIEEVFELYQVGLGYERIANRMNEKHGYMRWTKSKVEAIIKNQTYTGSIAWNRRGGRRNPVKHTDIIRADHNPQIEIIERLNWDETVKIRAEREIYPDPYFHQTPFILKDKLCCNECKKKMLHKNPGKNKTPVYYCNNKSGHKENCNFRIPIYKLESEFLNHINKLISMKVSGFDGLYECYLRSFMIRKRSDEAFFQELKNKIEILNGKNKIIKTLIVDEKSKIIQNVLKEQIVYNENIVLKYGQIEKEYEALIKKTPFEYECFNKKVSELINKIYSCEKENYSDEFDRDIKIRFAKRNFVIHFIDKIYVSYNKDTEKVKITSIQLL